jgi:hypothetical protein
MAYCMVTVQDNVSWNRTRVAAPPAAFCLHDLHIKGHRVVVVHSQLSCLSPAAQQHHEGGKGLAVRHGGYYG